MLYGGFLTLAHSHLHHYWQYPTMVGFCHGGNMLDNHDDDGDGEIGDTLITLIPAGSSILPPPGVSIKVPPILFVVFWKQKTRSFALLWYGWIIRMTIYLGILLVKLCVGRFGAIDKILWRLWPGWGFSPNSPAGNLIAFLFWEEIAI